MAQLREKGYADKYRHLGEPIHLIGAEFSREERNLAAFAVERALSRALPRAPRSVRPRHTELGARRMASARGCSSPAPRPRLLSTQPTLALPHPIGANDEAAPTCGRL